MKNIIELKYHKNSKQEIVFENLDEVKGEYRLHDIVLRLKDGDLTPLYSYSLDVFYDKIKLIGYGHRIYLPFCPKTALLRDIIRGICNTTFGIFCFDSKNLDDDDINLKNILPKWNIPEDSAVLFLNMNDCDKYAQYYDTYFTYPNIVNKDDLPQNCYNIGDYKHISIVVTELHAEDKDCQYHIDNINKVCKEIYEMTRIKPNLYVSHWFVKDIDYMDCNDMNHYFFYYDNLCLSYDVEDWHEIHCINKITTTNSTGILEVQDSERLTVIDCVEFFKEHLDV